MSTPTVSTRQQQITRAQVEHKMHEAKQIAEDNRQAMLRAKTSAEYADAVRGFTKAADDLWKWKVVQRALV